MLLWEFIDSFLLLYCVFYRINLAKILDVRIDLLLNSVKDANTLEIQTDDIVGIAREADDKH